MYNGEPKNHDVASRREPPGGSEMKNLRTSVVQAHEKSSASLDPVVRGHSPRFKIHADHERRSVCCARTHWEVVTRAHVYTYTQTQR